MKNILLCFLSFLIISGCQKKNDPRPTTLYLSGSVTNKQTSTPIDSVEIALERSYWFSGYILETIFFSDGNGKFNIQFNPQENKSYDLDFSKRGYATPPFPTSIDLDKEYQNFNITLDTL